ncbi:MAG TPA: T9SS type A sorting domain-containing protein, partial [Prolixibacteraceae bacterium]|nr:T9SS type A sorting domain-containing protein [Prolixibacteraceae bacterium]
GITYTLYYALPNDYDSTKNYPLVIGMHYCGGNATDYRTNLMGLCDSLRMVVVCPDNKSQVIPEEQLNMLVTAVDSSKIFYHVDEKQVYLTGMSCNGEFITRHGLNNFFPLKGLFPWDAWITAANPALYNFDCKIPAVIAVGSDDPNYKALIAVYDSLKAHQANVDLLIVPNVGHSLFPGFSNEMINCIYYMNGTPDFSFEPVQNVEMLNTDSVLIDVVVKNPGNKKLSFSTSVSNKNLVKKVEILRGDAENRFSLKVVANPKYKGSLIVTLKAFDAENKQLAQGFANVELKQATSTGELTPTNFKIYPVPVTDYLYFTSNEQSLSIHITDISGKLILNFDKIDVRGGIQIQSLSKGYYFLEAKGNTTNEKVKFLKL